MAGSLFSHFSLHVIPRLRSVWGVNHLIELRAWTWSILTILLFLWSKSSHAGIRPAPNRAPASAICTPTFAFCNSPVTIPFLSYPATKTISAKKDRKMLAMRWFEPWPFRSSTSQSNRCVRPLGHPGGLAYTLFVSYRCFIVQHYFLTYWLQSTVVYLTCWK